MTGNVKGIRVRSDITVAGWYLKRVKRFVLLAFVLASCGPLPADMDEMSKTISETLAEAKQPAFAAMREEVLLTNGFVAAIREAVESNAGYRAAIALEEEALKRIVVAQSSRRPQITVNANLGGIRETGGNTLSQTSSGIAGGINLSQLIYDGGESAASVNQATAEALLSQAARVVTGNEIALGAAKAWIDVWQFETRLALLRMRTNEIEIMVAQMERMTAHGFADRAALDGARRLIIDITLEETRIEADLRDSRVRFARFYNAEPDRLKQPDEIFTLAETRTAVKNWQHSPELLRSAANLLVARSGLAAAEAALRPRARLQMGSRSPLQEGESTDISFGLLFEYTLGDGKRRRSQFQALQARESALEAQLNDSQRTMEAEINGAISQLIAIERSMPLIAEQIRLSASEAKTSRSQISTGQSTLRQLVDAEVENYRARDRQIAMRAERQLLLLTIAARLGELGRRLGFSADRPR